MAMVKKDRICLAVLTGAILALGGYNERRIQELEARVGSQKELEALNLLKRVP